LNADSISGFWLPAAIFAAGGFLSLRLEKLVLPQCPGIRRPWQSVLVHIGLFLVCLAVVLAASGRSFFSVLLLAAGQLTVIQVSNAKYRALREPFIFSDFGIFSQTLRHPRLYLPFLGMWRILFAGSAAFVAIVVGWLLEKPAVLSLEWSIAALAAGTALVVAGLFFSPRLSLDPETDLSRHGLFAAIAQYWMLEKFTEPQRGTTLAKIQKPKAELPDIVVVQSESFFDPRRSFPGIRGDLLARFDQACREAKLHGQLSVPAWGANTMRPEFSFLTGIDPASLGIHRFNPYRRVARQPIRALPAVLREAGYRTICIHPHPSRFFRRDRAFPNLGFERFLDIREFPNAGKFGPYVSDKAVTDKLLGELSLTDQPVFLFAITMENHGPLHLEDVSEAETKDYFTVAPPNSCRDLQVYLRHLRSADEQLGRLRDALRARPRPYILVFYGEHLPSMPGVYDELGFPDGRTDYFVDSTVGCKPQVVDLEIAELPRRILGLIR